MVVESPGIAAFADRTDRAAKRIFPERVFGELRDKPEHAPDVK